MRHFLNRCAGRGRTEILSFEQKSGPLQKCHGSNTFPLEYHTLLRERKDSYMIYQKPFCAVWELLMNARFSLAI